MNARTELDALDAEVRSGTNTVEGYVQSVAALGTDIEAAVVAAKRFMFLTQSHALYPEFSSDSEEESELGKAAAAFESALTLR